MNKYQINLMYEVSIERFRMNYDDLPLNKRQEIFLDCSKVSDMLIDE